MPPPIRPQRKTDIDPAQDAARRQQLVQDLLTLGDNAFRLAAVKRWATGVDAPLRPLLQSMVIARIEWNPAEIGPMVRGAQGAFTARHWRWQSFLEDKGDGTGKWHKPGSTIEPSPLLSEGPHGDGVARVTAVFFLGREHQQGLEILLNPEVVWVAPGDQQRQVKVTPGLRRFLRSDMPRVLPPFRVAPV